MNEVDEHDCPYCGGIIDLGDWSPYTSEVREVTCPTCARVASRLSARPARGGSCGFRSVRLDERQYVGI
jgi:hypothetical protein